MYRVTVIVKEGLGSGFKLAGAEVRICPDSDAARLELRQLLGNSDYGLVLIEEDLMEELDDRMLRALDESDVPLVVPFPSLHPGAWERDEREYLSGVVRRAIGFQIRI
jgi:vacuolar-type H+-ATPase subunit F/Vma7